MSTPIPPRWLHQLWPWLAAALSGLLLALTFAPWHQGWLVWIGFAPLLCAIWFTKGGPGRAFGLGYVCGVVVYTVAFQWLSSIGALFREPLLMGIPFLLSLYLALYVGLWSWAVRVLAPRRPIDATSSLRHLGAGALAACAWVALEWTRGWLFSGFGWNGLGVPLHRSLVLAQIVELTGVLGLSWLVAFCNVMAVIIARRLWAELGPDFLKRVRWEFSGTMLVVALVFAYGVRATRDAGPPPQRPPGETVALRVATIQPNVAQDVKFQESSEGMILAKLQKLTLLAAQLEPHVILWPEAPAVQGMFADQTNYDFMMGLAAKGSFDLVIGSLDYEPDPAHSENLHVYNAAIHLQEHGAQQQVYRKLHLVPFGEYLPLRPFLPDFVGNLIASDLQAGTEPTVFTLTDPPVRVGPLICFEDSLGDLTRRSCLSGAQVLVNLTNDGWFQHTVGAEQHLANAVFRSIETRRPLVRSANTGLTGMVDVLGRWVPWIPPFQESLANREVLVPLHPPTTFYMRYGDWLGYGSSGVFFLWEMVRLLGAWRRRRWHVGQAEACVSPPPPLQ